MGMHLHDLWDDGQVNSYLQSSIIRFDGRPIMVVRATRDEVWFRPLNRHPAALKKNESCLTTDLLLDTTPVPLGFVFNEVWGKRTLWRAYRKPSRQWKIGLSVNNLRVMPAMNDTSSILHSTGLYNTIMGKFPSYTDALDKWSKDKMPIAFSRDFAIRKDGGISHYILPYPVGEVDDNGEVRLHDDYIYLSELLGRALHET